jgi:signal transduction histidine kinase
MEQERLASLGQLIGGIAHNLKTPIMSIAGGIDELLDLTNEYEESIGDPAVTEEDHHEIAAEMKKWLEKVRPYCTYMSEVISAVKGQAVAFNTSSVSTFTLDELIKRIAILMKHELIRGHCELVQDIQAAPLTEIRGEVNSLVQVFDNIIVNAIYAYEGANGIIEFNAYYKGGAVEFAIRDHAKGIPDALKNKLFKEMITTKGKDGTGLGLYMSYSTIRGRFGGNMWLESEVGVGTTIYISIPYTRAYAGQEAAHEKK